MSNGGYKGASPARKTSPEQYPGVWELTEQFQAQADGNWPFQAADCAPKSLRFNGSNAYLSRTPSVAGNRRTWTWSAWVKRNKLGVAQEIFESTAGGGSYWMRLLFQADDKISFHENYTDLGATTAVFRDPAAWMHICLQFNTLEAANNVKIFVNTELVKTYTLTQNFAGAVNSVNVHNIGKYHHSNTNFAGMQFCDVYLIDGQALEPSDFTFVDGQGILQPKRFTGDYSSGPVYSNFSDANGVVSSGNLSLLFDGNTTTNVNIANSNSYAVATQNQSIPVTSTIGMWTITGASYPTMRVTDTNGTVTVLDHNDTPIVNGGWTDFSYSGTVAKIELAYIPGSGSNNAFYALRVDGVALTDPSVGRNSFHLDFADSSSDAALGYDSSGLGNHWTPNNLTAAVTKESDNWSGMTTGSGYNSSTALSGAFDGSDSTRAAAAAGTAFVFTPSTPITGISKVRIKAQRDASQVDEHDFKLNGTNIGGSWSLNSTASVEFTVNNLTSLLWATKSNGQWYSVYKIEIFYDGSYKTLVTNTEGAGAIDSLVDSPVNGNEASTGAGGERRGNYATLSPLINTVATLSNGNLLYTAHGSTQHCVGSTIAVSSGKYYWEYTIETAGTYHYAGIADIHTPFTTNWCGSNSGWSIGINGAGNISWNNAENHGGIGISASSGQTWGWALDMDAGTLHVYVDGVIRFSGNSIVPSATSLLGRSITPAAGHSANKSLTFNFGQRPFKYQNAGTNRPSADYKPLATSFLPEPAIKRGDEAMDVKLYTGNGSSQTITGYNFSPDFAWFKSRNGTDWHALVDTVRGKTKVIFSNESNAEETRTEGVSSFNSDGFSLGDYAPMNKNNDSLVAFAWDAGDVTTTIAAGSLNSSLYDQSQSWSSGGGSGLYTGSNWTGTFDGTPAANGNDIAQSAYVTNSGSSQLTFGTAISGRLKVTTTQGSNNVSTGNNRPTVTLSDGTVLRVSAPTSTPEVLDFGTVSGITTLTIAGTSASGMNLISVELDGKLLADSNNVTGKTVTRLRFKTDWNWMYVSQIKINGSALTTGTLDNSGNVWSSVNAWKNGSTGSGNETYSQSARGDWFDVTLASNIANFSGLEIFMYLDSSAGSTTNIFEIELFFSDGTSYTKTYASASDAPNQSNYGFNGRNLQNFGALGDTVPLVPSIATTVRARPETGFSILNYSASGTAGATVAHQLGKAPEFMICKNRDHGQNWFMFHKTVGAGGGFNFNLNTAAYTTDTGYWNGDEPTKYVVNLGNYHGAFGTHDHVLYTWTSVEGYSSFGTYEGSNTNLPYIYTGFSPRWILIANMDNVNDYVIYDTDRDANNQSSTVLAANSNNPESSYSSGYELDILSNGFKIKTSSSGAINQNAHTHVYAAFASHPFASNARAR